MVLDERDEYYDQADRQADYQSDKWRKYWQEPNKDLHDIPDPQQDNCWPFIGQII